MMRQHFCLITIGLELLPRWDQVFLPAQLDQIACASLQRAHMRSHDQTVPIRQLAKLRKTPELAPLLFTKSVGQLRTEIPQLRIALDIVPNKCAIQFGRQQSLLPEIQQDLVAQDQVIIQSRAVGHLTDLANAYPLDRQRASRYFCRITRKNDTKHEFILLAAA